MRPLTSKDIEIVFNRCFQAENTILRGGASEPFYQPWSGSSPAILSYREDFASSALHEISHWCLAGKSRLLIPDFGYWYNPDGRDSKEQREFYRVEVRPQALESIFSEACGVRFNVSADNLAGNESSQEADFFQFCANVSKQRAEFKNRGLPPRAARFHSGLRAANSEISVDCQTENSTP